jgi:carbon storage regulator
MLVLSRKIGEEIQIGSSVSLRVLGISGGRVKLGIAGPRAVRVARGELPRQETGERPAADNRNIAADGRRALTGRG